MDTGKKKKVTEPVRLETGFSVREIACGGSTAVALLNVTAYAVSPPIDITDEEITSSVLVKLLQ